MLHGHPANILIGELKAVICPPHDIPRGAVSCGAHVFLYGRISKVETDSKTVHIVCLGHMMHSRIIFKGEGEKKLCPVGRCGSAREL